MGKLCPRPARWFRSRRGLRPFCWSCRRSIAGTKRDAVEKHQQIIGDVWSALIGEVFTKCKLIWHHRIPTDAAEQEYLRGLCERMLSLENHLLEVYRPYLHQWLEQEENRDFALRILRMIQFPDLPVPAHSQERQGV